MKKLLALALIAAFLIPAAAMAESRAKDWWIMTDSRPQPVKDAVRGGHWWWPINAASNQADAEMWGNRGLVYGYWQAQQPPTEEPPAAPPAAEPATVTRSVPVFNNVLFDFDSAELRPAADSVIANVVSSMKANGGDMLTVVGHTCDIGSDEYNQGLGQRRSDSVRSAVTDGGVSAGRVKAVSRGESDPAVPNTSQSNRALNRRAVFEYKISN